MRLSNLFGKTLREASAEAETVSHQLLLRAGLINQVAAGVYSYLPLAWRVFKKIEDIIRDEMNKAGGQELFLPTLQPFELWQESGRDLAFGENLFIVNDRRERRLVLAPTHEEVITQLASHNIQSYRDLPVILYQFQNKFRDEARPRAGLVRVREFIMKDAYSFDMDDAGLDRSYQAMLRAYQNVYRRCGLPALLVEADSGAIGGKDSHEFMLAAASGEDEIIHCPLCQYTANVEKARSAKYKAVTEKLLPPEEVATPGIHTIEALAKFLKIPESETLKAIFYIADKKLVLVVTRGDIEVNEVKLKNALKCTDLRLASGDEVREAGIVPGSASAIELKGIKTIGDESITSGANFVAGANKEGFHLRNVNYPRDFKVDILTDISKARAGDECLKCSGKLVSVHGIEVGHIFKLGIAFSEKFGATFRDQSGNSHPIIMGCYGIGLGRLLAAAIEQNHDERGIVFPMPIAPYHIYLCALSIDNPEVKGASEKLYEELESAGLEVLFDDRPESPGVKFGDADLLGIPIRLTVSPRTIKSSSVEIKLRKEKESRLVPVSEAVGKVKELVAEGMKGAV
ncbi:MAG: proline--tRNA ligase [Chloroflexota bacterium]